jgi:hypothetical protein
MPITSIQYPYSSKKKAFFADHTASSIIQRTRVNAVNKDKYLTFIQKYKNPK